ncbi:MAG: hypothetical protein ACO1OQ_04125 [Rufibacter sp.]
MSDLKQPAPRNEDEIDLRFLLIKVEKVIQAVGNLIRFFLVAILNNWALLAIICLVGGAAGFAFYKIKRPVYTSTMTMVLSDVRNDIIERLTENLIVMVNEKNADALSKNLLISANGASQIKEIRYFNVDQDKIEPDSVLAGAPFGIEVTLYTNNLFDSLERGYKNYLESNQYFAKRKRIDKEYGEMLLEQIDKNIASLDSAKRKVISLRGPVNGFVYGEPLDPANLYRQSMELAEKRAHFASQLKKIDIMNVVNGFAPRLYPTGPNRNNYIIIGMLSALAFGILLVLILEKRKISSN